LIINKISVNKNGTRPKNPGKNSGNSDSRAKSTQSAFAKAGFSDGAK